MKKVHFISQAKGGAGKSMLTYLLALKNESNTRSYFIDLDSSVMTSSKQLQFLKGQKPTRFALMNLLDGRDKLDRQLLFENLLELTQKDYDDFYLDFGAPESDQLPSLFTKDYSALEFKQIEQELNCEFIFNIVVAGGGAYPGCTQYLQKMTDALDGNFQVIIYANQATFQNHLSLIDELKAYTESKQNKVSSLKLFGDFDITTAPHKNILRLIEEGRGTEAYVFIEKIKIQKELSKI
jgi:cellulose biosynthesis protein BcsQ